MTRTAARRSVTPSPQEQIMAIAIGVVQGRCLVAAAELGIADALAKGPLHVDAIGAEIKADAGNVFRLMRALETIGFFQQVSPRVFANTPLSDCLRSDAAGSQRAFLQLLAPGLGMWDGYTEMLSTLRTGKTALFERWGYDLWEHYRRDPYRSAIFNESMRSMTAPMTPAVTAAYDWSQFAVIADIAGGIGTQLIDILDANPNCDGVIFDEPDVLAAAIEHERVKLVPGNFFEEIPINADAYILRNIVHDWNDEDALAILRTLRRATRPTARVMLIEWLIPESSDVNFGKWTDITMMTSVGGRERTKTEFETLFSEAGFELEEIVPTASSFSIVVGRPSV